MGSLHKWFKGSKSVDGKPGWVEVISGEPCAREEDDEDETPKCVSSDKRASMTKAERISAQRRKSAADPNQSEKSGASKPTYVPTDKPKMNEETDKKGKGSGKKDACYTKVKSRYDVWPSAYACVPIETSKALTKSGWKSYDQLNIGDEILTFSLEKNNLEFKPIQNLHFYENSPTYVVKNGNTGWKFECTPNHKWVVKYPECKGSRGRKKYTNLINNMQLISIEEILNESGSNRKLVISSKYNEGTPISLDKIYKYETNWVEYLFNCSAEQRESWLYSAIVYDGNQIKTERLTEKKEDQSDCEYVYDTPYNKQSFGFKQKDINHRDAFLLSAFLNGGLVTFRKNTRTNIYSCHYVSYDGTKSLEGFKLIENNKSNVWCPQTENGTWVMMQETDGNGVITITGNSGALVKCRKVGAANWGNKSESIDLISKDSLSEAIGMVRYCPKCEKDETRDECKYGPKYWDMFSTPSSLSTNQMKFSIAQVHPANESKEYKQIKENHKEIQSGKKKDDEGYMARSEFGTIMKAVSLLRKNIKKGNQQIPAWVQSKITKATDYIDTAADYLDSDEEVSEDVNIEDANGNTFLRIIDIIRPDRLVRETISPTIRGGKSTWNFPVLPKENPENVPIRIIKGKEPQLPLAKGEGGSPYEPYKAPKEDPKNPYVPAPERPKLQLAHYEFEGKTLSQFMIEASAAWQRKEGKNPEGGLNATGVASYRAQNPGSKLQTAVTTKPSKLKPGSKDAKRRKSFCARMGGMPGPMKDEKGRPTRKALSLKKWNC